MQANDSRQPLSLEATEEEKEEGRNIGSVGRRNKLEFFWQTLKDNRTFGRVTKKSKSIHKNKPTHKKEKSEQTEILLI